MKRYYTYLFLILFSIPLFSQIFIVPVNNKLIVYLDWSYFLSNYPELVNSFIDEETMFDKKLPERLGININSDVKNLFLCYSSDDKIDFSNREYLEKDMAGKSYLLIKITKPDYKSDLRVLKYAGYDIYQDKKLNLRYFSYGDNLIFSYNINELKKFIDFHKSGSNEAKREFNIEKNEFLYIEGIFYSDYLKLIKYTNPKVIESLKTEIEKIKSYRIKVFENSRISVDFLYNTGQDASNSMKILNGLLTLMKFQAYSDKKMMEKISKISIERNGNVININLLLDKKDEKDFINNLLRMMSPPEKK